MPIDCEIDSEAGIVYTTIVGQVSANEVIEKLAAVITSTGYRPGFNGLIDLTKSSYTPKGNEVRQIAQLLVSHNARIGHSRSALVVSRDLGYGLARMFQEMADESVIETRIFRDMTEARTWLGLNNTPG